MTVQTPQVPSLVAAAPIMNVAGASDTFAAQDGANYLLWIANAGGSPSSVVIDDPTSLGPDGNTAFNPDVTVSVPATTGVRIMKINASRFKNASGMVGITFTPNASVTYAILGPL